MFVRMDCRRECTRTLSLTYAVGAPLLHCPDPPTRFDSGMSTILNRIPPGNLLASFARNINANKGKWFRHANHVSSPAFNAMIAILAPANVA